MNINELGKYLHGTHIAEIWQSLLTLYDSVDHYTVAFQQRHAISCPVGCGTCCEHFIPEITTEEASLVAAYILLVKQDCSLLNRLESFDESSPVCPLYDKDSPFHCTVYPARALICRLFGACPSSDKQNRPIFRRCKYNTRNDTPEFVLPQEFLFEEQPVSVMSVFGTQLKALTADQILMPIHTSVLEAAGTLQFIERYFTDNDSGPDIPNSPTPVAS